MRPKTISASSLANAQDCLAKFAAVNLDYIPEVGKKEAAAMGSVIHHVAQWFVYCVWIKKTHAWDDMEKFMELFEEGWVKHFKTFDTRSKWYDEALELALAWRDRTDLSEVEVLSVEEKRRTPVPSANYDKKKNAQQNWEDNNAAVVPLSYIWDRADWYVHPITGLTHVRVVDYKGLALDTPIPTPTGWTTMGEIQEGDELYGGDTGEVCRVVHKSTVKNRNCYRISFDDGTSVVCDDEHRWEVDLIKSGKRAVLTPLEMLQHGIKGASGRQCDISIQHSSIEGEGVELPVDPYVFGVWIGDGDAHGGSITKDHQPLFDEIERRGYEVGPNTGGDNCLRRTVFGLIGKLRDLGVLKNKHLPDVYLRASRQQRLDLLRGIMDTDGHWNFTRKRAVLNTTQEAFARQVYELVVSLGWTANIFPVKAHGFGKEWDSWQLWFTPTGEDVFLSRHPNEHGNGDYVAPTSSRPFRRVVTAIEAVDSVPTQCIEVDSADHCFRAGRQFVKTHNTQRLNMTESMLVAKLQCQIYAMCAMIYFREIDRQPDVIEVELDMLRYGPVTAKFTPEQCVKTWRDLRKELQRILDTSVAQAKRERTLGPGCRYCPIAPTCDELQRNIDGGGLMSLSLEETIKMRVDLEAQMKTSKVLIDQADMMIAAEAVELDMLEFQVGQWDIELKSAGRSSIPQDQAQIIMGTELYANYAPLTMTKYKQLMKSDVILTEEQKIQLSSIVEKTFGDPKVRVSARNGE